MPGNFEVGSIVARLRLDDSEWLRGARQLVQKARQVGSDLKRALGKKSQIDFIQERPILNALNVISRRVRTFAKTVRTQLAKAFKFTFSTKPILLGLRGLQKAATTAAGVMRRSFLGVQRVFQRLRSFIFGLQGTLAALGIGLTGLALVQRAREVETIGTAFDNLSRSIGAVSSTFITKLRSATKGAVSDLELMRTANNAVLLGVAKNEDEFADLASLARQLGRAVGRDAVDAINDLTIGIGRQSRLILDNLGLIVKVGEATEKYAAALGRNVESLSDAERRQAFMNAAMDAARRKVAELGPDVDTINDAWGRFTAAISNTATTIAQAFVGGGPFNAISKWLNDNKNEIAAFAQFASEVLTELVTRVGRLIGSLFAGGNLRDITRRIRDFVKEIIRFTAVVLIEGLKLIFGKLGLIILALIGQLFLSILTEIGAQIAKLLSAAAGQLAKGMLYVFSKIPGLSDLLGLDTPENLDRAMGEIEQMVARDARAIEGIAEDLQGNINSLMEETLDLLDEEVDTALGKASKNIEDFIARSKAQGSQLGGALSGALAEFQAAADRLKLRRADDLIGFKGLTLQRELQPLADQLQRIVQVRRQLIQDFPEQVGVQQVTDSGNAIQAVIDKLVEANKAFVEFAKGPEEAKDALGRKFSQAALEAQDALEGLSAKMLTFGARNADAARSIRVGFGESLAKFREFADASNYLDLAGERIRDVRVAFEDLVSADVRAPEEFEQGFTVAALKVEDALGKAQEKLQGFAGESTAAASGLESIGKAAKSLEDVVAMVQIASTQFGTLAKAPQEVREEIGAEFRKVGEAAQKAVSEADAAFDGFTQQTLGDSRSAVLKLQEALRGLAQETLGLSGFNLSAAFDRALAPVYLASEEFQKILSPFTQREAALAIEVKTIGLEESEKELKKFDLAFEEVRDRLSPEDLGRMEAARKALADILSQRDAAKQADEAVKKLEELDREILDLSRTAQQGEIGQFGVQILQLRDALGGLKEDLPTVEMAAFEERFRRLIEGLAETELGRVNEQLRELDLQLQQSASSAAAVEVQRLEQDFGRFAQALRSSGLEAEKVNDILDRMRNRVDALQEKTAFADLDDALKSIREKTAQARFEFEQMSRTPLQQAQREIVQEFNRMVESATAATNALIAQRIAAGADADEIQRLRDRLAEFNAEAQKQADQQLETAAKVDIKARAEENARVIGGTLERNLGSAIVSAVQDGESVFKQGSRLWAGLFEDAMNQAIKRLSAALTSALSKLFESMGGGGAAAGIATGLLGLAGAIMSNLESESSSAIDDFDSQINSSEAVRGVVAGPSNVAISKIGDSLKQAMRTTELLLADILATLQQGGGGAGGAGGDLSGNSSLPLSTSTAT